MAKRWEEAQRIHDESPKFREEFQVVGTERHKSREGKPLHEGVILGRVAAEKFCRRKKGKLEVRWVTGWMDDQDRS